MDTLDPKNICIKFKLRKKESFDIKICIKFNLSN